ncbi:recombination mediator RecR [Guggenheimella bovis]
MDYYPESVNRLIEELSKLPGIGQKSAVKLTGNIIDLPTKDAVELAQAIVTMKRKVHFCKRCFHLTEDDFCSICLNEKRDPKTVLVVDTPRDLVAIEKTREYKGLYHVLHGRISPLDNVRPEDLTIEALLHRIESEGVEEVILANSPTLEGEATAVYLSKRLEEYPVKVTRIAHGVPIGGDLEFADEMTLLKALEGRHSY